ncbi:MAG: 2-C-methyl-D-erythritol 4-phosphate cytidylyltransferase [Oscillospiraceae bacterium]|jgi:2-C-methyl-D-erythritol 4-phosphate cytidylyltransferase|nr:2-C-methyl-D-erythritol 4-phosphate cytidylyltransferase [Saccharofermentans sp.]MDO4876679.1 2-C-methyl-D-erythritol 4-phosphate cytidylyltransferase [Oscillospiraceae bacterium]
MNRKCYFLIPAAGSGKRMGGPVPKLMIDVLGLPVIARTLGAIDDYASSYPDIDCRIILITTEDLKPKLMSIVTDYFPGLDISYAEGGATRSASVLNGIRAIEDADDDDLVLIHDGARCLVTKEEIKAVYEGLETSPVCASAVAVKDTLKKTSVSKDGKVIVESTPNRSDYYAVRTPQGFRFSELMKCVDYYASEEGITATDDTLIAERCGLTVTLVEGSYANIKITTPEDVAVAREIVRARWQKQPFED